MFAIEKIDPTKGRVVAYQIEFTTVRGDSNQVLTEIPMVDCHELLVEGYINNENFNPYDTDYRFPIEFICPDTRSMLIQGHWASKTFSYVEVAFMGCDEDSLTNGN